MASSQTSDLLRRVLPLPKEIEIRGRVHLMAGDIGLDIAAPVTPPVKTAIGLLSQFARGSHAGSSFVIRLALAGAGAGSRLAGLPNAAEAYEITSGSEGRLLLAANRPAGLLHAARTLTQLVRPLGYATTETQIDLPLVHVVDWPDLAERGQWGGNAAANIAFTSQWKMNVVEVWAEAGLDAAGRPAVKIRHDLFRQGDDLAVKIVPYILHLEQVTRYAGLMDRQDLISTPDPSQPLPSDYTPGLCMSSPATRELVAGWLKAAAGIEGVTDVMVWLSEGAAPCYCPACIGKEPFALEVECITSAFERIKPEHPGVRLRLLTTQGSYPVNDRVLAAAPSDVGITYYDGGRTYDSSRSPMIYPLLEEFAASGRWLGVYPQITHCWRTTFPWTAPQFIHYRAQEFVSKKLSCMIGYAVPSNSFHEFNVMAEAEWVWNAGGRSPADFAAAYAIVTGIAKNRETADQFAAWALLAGEAGWTLAESRLLLTLIYDPALGLTGGQAADHRFEAIAKVGELHRDPVALATAREALVLARQIGLPVAVDESAACLAGLEFLAGLQAVIPALQDLPDADHRAELLAGLDALEAHAYTLRRHVLAWAERIAAAREEKLHTRLTETAVVMLRTVDALRRAAARAGVTEALTCPEYTLQPLASWNGDDFAAGPSAVLRIDLRGHLPDDYGRHAGRYQVGFDFSDSAYGTSIESLRLLAQPPGRVAAGVLSESPDTLGRDVATVSIFERWKEFRLDIPPVPAGSVPLLEVGLYGLPVDAPEGRRTCAGRIGLRRLRE